MPSPGDFLKWCLRRIIKFEEVVDGRYAPVCCTIVTRKESEILLVGNDYKTGQLIFWNFPGGAVRCAEFMPYAESYKRLAPAIAIPLRDWLTKPRNT
jgi:hypothetical protein